MNTNHMTGEELALAYCTAVFCASFSRNPRGILNGPCEELYSAGCANMGEAEFKATVARIALRYFGLELAGMYDARAK